LGGDGSHNNLATDPIKAKHLINQLTNDELAFFEHYMNANPLEKVYEAKGMATKNVLTQTRAQLAGMPTDRQVLIQQLYAEISSIDLYIADKYFNSFSPSILNDVTLSEGAASTVIEYTHVPLSELPITQDVKWEFLKVRKSEVEIKSRQIRTEGTTHKVNITNYQNPHTGKTDWEGAIAAQNTIIHNPADIMNDIYVALALEIFGDRLISSSSSIRHHASILRSAAADYILANKENYLPLMLEKYYHVRPSETEATVIARLKPDLQMQLRDYCRWIRNNSNFASGTSEEMEAIGAVVGVPIHVFYTNFSMEVGSKGIEDGVIQPNAILGGRFAGAPIRLQFDGIRYLPIRLQTY
jgi:hypothetical protein